MMKMWTNGKEERKSFIIRQNHLSQYMCPFFMYEVLVRSLHPQSCISFCFLPYNFCSSANKSSFQSRFQMCVWVCESACMWLVWSCCLWLRKKEKQQQKMLSHTYTTHGNKKHVVCVCVLKAEKEEEKNMWTVLKCRLCIATLAAFFLCSALFSLSIILIVIVSRGFAQKRFSLPVCPFSICVNRRVTWDEIQKRKKQ